MTLENRLSFPSWMLTWEQPSDVWAICHRNECQRSCRLEHATLAYYWYVACVILATSSRYLKTKKFENKYCFWRIFIFFLLRLADARSRTLNLLAAGRLPWPFGYGVPASTGRQPPMLILGHSGTFPWVRGRAKVGGGDWPMLQFSSLCQHAGEHVYMFPSSSSVTILSKHFISAIYYRLSATRYNTTDIVAFTLRIKFWFRAS